MLLFIAFIIGYGIKIYMKIGHYMRVLLLLSILFSYGFAQANEAKTTLDIAYTTAIAPYLYDVNEVTTGRLVHSIHSILGEEFILHIKHQDKASLERSHVDVVIGTAPSIESLPFIKAFTIATIPLTLFYSGDEITTIEEAKNMQIGYVDFGLSSVALQEYYPTLSITTYPTVQKLLSAMKEGEIQGCILPEATLSFFIQNQWKEFITPLGYIGINLYVQKDNTVLLNRITSLFVDRLMQEETQSSPVLYIVIFSLLLALLIILVLFYRRKHISFSDALRHTTMEITEQVFFDHFVCTITKSGIITSVSSGIMDILGYEPDAVVGISIKTMQKEGEPFVLPPKEEMQHCSIMHINGTLIPLVFFPIKVITTLGGESQYEFIVFNIGQLIERQEHAFSIMSLYQTIFARAPVGIARYDVSNTSFIHVNPVFEAMTHTSAKELNHYPLETLIGSVANTMIEKAKYGIVQELISLHHEGKEERYIVYGNGLYIANKYYIDMFFVDITDTYQEKQDITQQATYLQNIIDVLPAPTLILDKDKYITVWNNALEELTGVSSKVMIGKNDGSYSIPFYGSIRKMLCDIFYEKDELQDSSFNKDDTISIEAFCPNLGNGKYLWVGTKALHDTNGELICVIQTMHDITKSKEHVFSLEQSKERYATVLEASNEGIWEVDCETYTIHASAKCYEILGLEQGSHLDYSTLLSCVFPEYQEAICSRMQLLLEGKIERAEFVFRMFISESSVKWIQSAVFANKNTTGAVSSIIGSLADITEQKEHENTTRIIFLISNTVNIAREPKDLFQAIHSILTRYVGYTNLVVALWNEKENCLEYPYYFDEHCSKEEYIANRVTKENAPRPIADVFATNTQIVTVEQVDRGGFSEECVWLATPLRVFDSVIGVIATYKVHTTQRAIDTIYSNNDKELMVAIGEQIGIAIERYNSREQLTAMALHDPLTGLPNRVLFSDRLEHAIRRVHRSADYRFAVFMLDLDRFKLINDTYGHNTGDLLLIEVARRIQPLLRSQDTFARLGGDEFAIILENINSTHEVIAVAKRILRAIEQPLVIEGKELKTGTSIGIVLDGSGYDSAHTLLRDADIAMYDAKTNGKGRYRIFDQPMHQQMLEYVSLESELNNAIENNELFLEYQPITDVETLTLMGFEALVRWNNPERGIVYPNKFINIAEENGFIIKLGEWVLEEACRVMKKWVDIVPESAQLCMSVNLSAKQAVQGNLTRVVMDIIDRTGVQPSQINLEVTETTIMKDPKNAKASFDELRKSGICISIDDFGSGYSSMTYLQRFKVDILKIDREFIQNASTEDGGIEIVRAICALAHGLGMKVIAEGVETQEQLDIVKECKCDYIQGFFFSRPLMEDKAFQYLQEHIAHSE